jgi:hypothetical protein
MNERRIEERGGGAVFELVQNYLDWSLKLFYDSFEHVQTNPWEEPDMYVVNAYVAYLLISIALTIWVGRTLYRRGRVFLVDAFRGNAELADSVNHLLVTGFYLINIGYVTLALRTTADLISLRAAIELLADKIGLVLLVLGGMHFFNLYLFSRARQRARGQAE